MTRGDKMKLCDDCIKILKNDLSEEAIAILNKVELFNELSERDLVRKLSLNHKHLKKLLYELEVKLFLTYESYGRTKAYHLTENGSRLLRLEENNAEVDLGFKREDSDEANKNFKEDNINKEDQTEENENLAEVKDEDSELTENKVKAENKETEEEVDEKELAEEEQNQQQSKDEEKELEELSSNKEKNNLIWDFK